MRATTIREHGGPEVLRDEELSDPSPGPGEVRVAVKAVGVNHVDVWVRRGLPHLRHEYPFLLGADVSGVIDAVGAGVRDLREGDEIVANPGHSCGRCRECLSGRDNLCRWFQLMGEDRPGGYAEKMILPSTNVVPKPANLSYENAAAVPVTFLTAWQMLTRKAPVHPGDEVLVMAAGAGVGVAAIQIAKLHGARVIATAGSDDKLQRARELGADETINHSTRDLVAEVKRITKKRGVDIVFEHVGGETFTNAILCAKKGGAIVTCGATAGFTPTIDLRHVFFRQLQILGSTMAPKGDLYPILDHVGAGRLRPILDRVLPLSRAAEAHRALESRAVFGKIVLLPGA